MTKSAILIRYSLDGRNWQAEPVQRPFKGSAWTQYAIRYDNGVIEPYYCEQCTEEFHAIRLWPRGNAFIETFLGCAA